LGTDSVETAASCPDQSRKDVRSVVELEGTGLNAEVVDVDKRLETRTASPTSPDVRHSPKTKESLTSATQASTLFNIGATMVDCLNLTHSAEASTCVVSGLELEQPPTKERALYDHSQAPELSNMVAAGSDGGTSYSRSHTDAVDEYVSALNELQFLVKNHLDNPEINALVKSVDLTVGQMKLMPVFDPRSALGLMILADRQPMHKGISVPLQYVQLLQESHAEVNKQRARARHLLQQVHRLEPWVPAEHKMKIPARWEVVARDPIWRREGVAAKVDGGAAVATSSLPYNEAPLSRNEIRKMRKRMRAAEIELNGPTDFAASKRPAVLQPSTMNTEAGGTQDQHACCENEQQGHGHLVLLPSPTRALQTEGDNWKTPHASAAAEWTDSRAIHPPISVVPPPVSVEVPVVVPAKTLEASTTSDKHFRAHDNTTSGGLVAIDSMESEVTHDCVLSEQDVIRLELERMKKMYDEWLSQ